MYTVQYIRQNNLKITHEPIVYSWWFKTSCFPVLLNLLNEEIVYDRIRRMEFNDESYGLLYIGKGINGNGRLINYHIHDSNNFHLNGVENGRLSSLRQTLCGLLQRNMSASREFINNFMDRYCAVDFEICTEEGLDTLERLRITNNYLPLNYQNTKGILTSGHRRILRECKREMRN